MQRPICVTGIKPTGSPHLGNYVGAIRPGIKLSKQNYNCFFFIADYHSLSAPFVPKELKESIYDVAASWMACGLDASTSVLYQQSHVPEVCELNWILNCFTNKGLLNRAHAYKAKVQDNLDNERDSDHGVNMGLFCYPVLMASDIIFLRGQYVPVGEDQLQHIEIARNIASTFNHTFKKEVLTLPEGIAQKETLLKGLDGRKMSKSYNNNIPLFVPEKKLRKLINKITTDSLPPEAPKDPKNSLVMDIFLQFANEKEVKALSERFEKGISWGEAKECLFDVVNREVAPAREKYEQLMANRRLIDQVLEEGAAKVRPLAKNLLQEVKEVIGVQ